LVRAFNEMAAHISALIQAQQRFIADVSHEIKSPLARLSMAAALARRCSSPEAEAHFDRLEREIDTASSLVRELQVLSTLQGANTLPRREMVNLADVVAAAIDNVAFEWDGRPHNFRLDAPAEQLLVFGDHAVLQRALENLLRNAVFYAPEGTEVVTTIGRHNDLAQIVVCDQGQGVPEAALPLLFDAFYRVDNSRTRNTGGVGLGLAIVARAIDLHGGRVTAANAVPSGLRICINLPLASAQRISENSVSVLSNRSFIG
jgi:signal transduction histidine kinase